MDISIGFLSEEEDLTSRESIKENEGMALLPLIKKPQYLLAKAGVGLLKSLYRFQQVYNPILFIFAVLGWIGIIKKGSSYALKANFYILTYHFFFFGLVFPFFLVNRRYTSQMISISIPWAAFGFLISMEWVYHRWKIFISKKRFAIILLIIISILLFIQGRIIHPREHRIVQREAGLWMKDHLPRGVKLMSRRPQEAFYSELPWVHMPEGDYEEILKTARSIGIQYLIIDESIEKDSPYFWRKLKGEDLILLKEFKKENRKMLIFEIVYSKRN